MELLFEIEGAAAVLWPRVGSGRNEVILDVCSYRGVLHALPLKRFPTRVLKNWRNTRRSVYRAQLGVSAAPALAEIEARPQPRELVRMQGRLLSLTLDKLRLVGHLTVQAPLDESQVAVHLPPRVIRALCAVGLHAPKHPRESLARYLLALKQLEVALLLHGLLLLFLLKLDALPPA